MVADARLDIPLYTVAEAARHLGIAASTVRYWVHEKGIVQSLPAENRGEPTLPFIALAEIEFIHSLRRAGLRLRAVTEGVGALKRTLGRDYLRADLLRHDGTDILMRVAEQDAEWLRARDQQSGIPGVLELGLQAIQFDGSGVPERVVLRQYQGADIVIDPRFSFGQPVVENRGVRVEDIAQLFFAGEDVDVVSAEFGVPPGVVQEIIRNYRRRLAA